jgi:aspartyl-tRNA(Asn)/glutamyl-tRNA(Gln) amidotransferase subunit B
MYKPTIGLEVHVELNTKSKMFCDCKNDFNEKHPNVNICPICLGHPGTLPIINKEAIKKVIKTGLALNCKIPPQSQFDRKNYFYPDLPKGYQISQLYYPLCQEGFLEINGKKNKIRKIHLEEDTGKLIHEKDYSLIDFNRAGVPLMELVTEPDITSAKEAKKFAEELQIILKYLNVSGADMEKGQMRLEVNISLTTQAIAKSEDERSSSPKTKKLGTKVEIKNLNSFKAIEKAIDYEIKRQADLLNQGKKIVQETRGWHDTKQITFSQRKKEESKDYRYFPEPDLPPLFHSKEFINKIHAKISELPQQKRKRLKRKYKLDDKSIEIFIYNKDLGEYFEKVISKLPLQLSQEKFLKLIKLSVNYIITDLQGLLGRAEFNNKNFLITPENFVEFIFLIHEGKISSKIAKMVLEKMFKTGADPDYIIRKKDLTQITDEKEIEKIIHAVLLKNPKPVEDYKKGKTAAFQFLVGQIMIQTKGRVAPGLLDKILQKLLQ